MSSDNINKEIANTVSSTPPGTYKLYLGTDTGVDNNIKTHLENMAEIGKRINHAIEVNCHIEVISLRIQIIDFWLRVFFVNRASYDEQRGKEFGKLLKQCNRLGLDNELFQELQEFNKLRIKAIHGYVVGATYYEELIKVSYSSKMLATKVVTFVLLNCGKVISEFDGSGHVGDMIINVPAQIQHLQDSVSL